MGNLKEIETRHGWDSWRDAVFIIAAVVLTALSISAVTSKAAGKPTTHQYTVKVVDPISGVELR